MSEVHQGEVYWVDLGPIRGSAPAERHPCVVVQGDLYNRSRISTTVVCLITSNLERAKAPGNVPLNKGAANLPKASVVNISQILTVDKSELTEKVGRVSSTILGSILDGLWKLFGRQGQIVANPSVTEGS